VHNTRAKSPPGTDRTIDDRTGDPKAPDSGLTVLLAARVMGWAIAPDRYLMDNRRWMPRWRFQPEEKLVDAFRLLEAAAPELFEMNTNEKGLSSVRARIGGTTGEARDQSKPRAITLAIAKALQIDVGSLERPESQRPGSTCVSPK
jgi:hypothetical protein